MISYQIKKVLALFSLEYLDSDVKFHMQQQPPTTEQIEIERERLRAQLDNIKKYCYRLPLIINITFLSLSFFVSGWLSMVLKFIAAIALSLVILSVFISNKIKDKLKNLDYLTEVAIDRCPEIAALCKEWPKCENYRLVVANLDRSLTVGEANMIESYASELKERKEEDTYNKNAQRLKSKTRIGI